MNLIAAADENWGIGKNGGLLAHISGDMKYFRETTKGKIVVMGRKTLESFPGGKPLKNRVNIVLTGNKDFVPEGVVICHSVEETLEKLKEYPKEDVFIIGGGMIYKAFLPWCKSVPGTGSSREWQQYFLWVLAFRQMSINAFLTSVWA